MENDYEAKLREHRREREAFFEESPHSPIPSGHGAEFSGLAYYPIDVAYRFELDLSTHDDAERFTIETSTGGTREYLRWGEFRFELDGAEQSLQAYKAESNEEWLWVPFRDRTNGEETYAAGRYLDLEPPTHRTADETWILDFNEAYNPTCAYNEAYECPLIPTDNWLEVRVEAGEMDYPGEPIAHSAHHHG